MPRAMRSNTCKQARPCSIHVRRIVSDADSYVAVLGKVGLDVNLHYYGKTLSLCCSCIHLHAASTVFAYSYRPPFEISDLDRH